MNQEAQRPDIWSVACWAKGLQSMLTEMTLTFIQGHRGQMSYFTLIVVYP